MIPYGNIINCKDQQELILLNEFQKIEKEKKFIF